LQLIVIDIYVTVIVIDHL